VYALGNMAKPQIKFDDDLLGGATNPYEPIFTEALFTTIIDRVANGETLLRICEEDGMPNRTNFYDWLKKDGAQARYDAAVIQRTTRAVEELTEIADDGRNDFYQGKDGMVLNAEHVSRSKLRVETRKWLASKILPNTYGDKTTIVGANNTPLIPANSDAETARRVAFLLTQGLEANDGGPV
jgi:hypothetical protein